MNFSETEINRKQSKVLIDSFTNRFMIRKIHWKLFVDILNYIYDSLSLAIRIFFTKLLIICQLSTLNSVHII